MYVWQYTDTVMQIARHIVPPCDAETWFVGSGRMCNNLGRVNLNGKHYCRTHAGQILLDMALEGKLLPTEEDDDTAAEGSTEVSSTDSANGVGGTVAKDNDDGNKSGCAELAVAGFSFTSTTEGDVP